MCVSPKNNLASLREALIAYHADHGFFPCTTNDWNYIGHQDDFKKQLTWFTDAEGNISKTRSKTFHFGPYLQEFPENPFYPSTADSSYGKYVEIDQTNKRSINYLTRDIANYNGNLGWYYEAQNGNVVANLGGNSFSDRYVYY